MKEMLMVEAWTLLVVEIIKMQGKDQGKDQWWLRWTNYICLNFSLGYTLSILFVCEWM
jgi:hypothetical protein